MFPRSSYLNTLIERKKNGLVKIITGLRRVGKSYLLNKIFYLHLLNEGVDENHIVRFAFDSSEDIDLLNKYYPEEKTKIYINKHEYVINSKKFRAYINDKINDDQDYYLLLDEVQLLEDFVSTLNSFLRHSNYDIYITGSNSRFLTSDIVTEFRGRGSKIHIYPLTFKEYQEGLNLSVDEAWKNYLETGGLPLVALMKSEEERKEYLKDMCLEIYLKDIVNRYKINDEQKLKDILNVVSSSIASYISPYKISNTFKTYNVVASHYLIDKYISYFEDAFILSTAKRYDVKGRKYINSPYKIYFEDVGIRNAKLEFRQVEETHLMENIIYNELRYRGFDVSVGNVSVNEPSDRLDKNGKIIFEQKQLEIDFVASKFNKTYYIQCALSINDEDKMKQEKKPLEALKDGFEKIIIVKNRLKPTRDNKGIVIVDLFDFLLNSLDF